jgi:hypothetical protein
MQKVPYQKVPSFSCVVWKASVAAVGFPALQPISGWDRDGVIVSPSPPSISLSLGAPSVTCLPFLSYLELEKASRMEEAQFQPLLAPWGL